MIYLKKFQAQHGLTPDGIIGKNTLNKMKEVFNLNNNQLAHFLGQIDHETHGFVYGEENLNYSKEGLLKVFGKYFDEIFAEKYARKPKKIANIVYANRMGNGNTASGDGWKYRGRGAIQLTGKDNYKAFSDSIDKPEIMDNPILVANTYYFESALFFFNNNNLWRYTSTVDKETITKLTRRINGGTNGLEDRIEKTMKYYNILNK